MDVKPGYKQTEVGIIPEDWEIATIGDLSSCFSGGTPLTSNQRYYGGNIPWITSGDLNHIRIKEVEGRITAEGLANSAAKVVNKGTLLLALYGATAGVSAISEIRAAINQAVLAITPKRLTSEYLFQFLRLRKDSYIKTYSQGGQPNFSGEIVKSFLIPLPSSKAEQEAIGEALSDTDALIESLEQLLAKKRRLKQGAMQELLTGKKRLPGFRGEWKVERLGEVCRITTGRKDVNQGNPNGQYPFFTCAHSHTYSDSYSFDTEAILIAGNGDVGNLHYFNGKFEAYQRTYILSAFSVPVDYLWQQLTAYLAESLGLGKIGSSIPYIKKENLIGFSFHSPHDEAEQEAIATILDDMDAEITALEAKLTKARQLKQGMMQELLTGRIRLV